MNGGQREMELRRFRDFVLFCAFEARQEKIGGTT